MTILFSRRGSFFAPVCVELNKNPVADTFNSPCGWIAAAVHRRARHRHVKLFTPELSKTPPSKLPIGSDWVAKAGHGLPAGLTELGPKAADTSVHVQRRTSGGSPGTPAEPKRSLCCYFPFLQSSFIIVMTKLVHYSRQGGLDWYHQTRGSEKQARFPLIPRLFHWHISEKTMTEKCICTFKNLWLSRPPAVVENNQSLISL